MNANTSLTQCPHCSTPVPEGARFCIACGREIVAAQAAANICPNCGHTHTPPIPSHCVACGFPLAASSSTVTTPNVQPPTPRRPRRLPRFNLRAAIALSVLAALGAGGWLGWQWWNDRSGRESGVEACQPATRGDDFTISNPNDLQGELKRDTVFAANEAYTIAENASLTVPKGRTLLIEPGARVRFGQASRLIVEGTLSACGTDGRRILFTADSSSGRPGFWTGIELRSPESGTVLGNATIEFAGRDGHAPLWIEGGDVLLDDLKFDSNQWYALSLDPDSAPRLRPPFTIENGPQGWEVRGGTLDKTREWNAAQPYILNGIVEVTENAKLSLAPATTLKFQPNSALRVHGELRGTGAADQLIRFTSVNDEAEDGAPKPQAGDWAGLQIVGRKAKVALAFAELVYAGGGAPCLWIEAADPALTDFAIRDCASFSISTDIVSTPAFERLTLTEAKVARRWEMRASQLDGNAKHTLPRILLADGQTPLMPTVTGWVGVGEQASLTIGPGVTVLFEGGDRAGLWADGELQVNGTEAEPVTLTSARDAAFGGEGGAAAGDWAGLHVTRSRPDTVVLSHLHLKYGGVGDGGCLRLREGAAPTLDSVTVADCATYPISSDAAAQPIINGLRLSDNTRANQWEVRESTLEDRREWTWSPLASASGETVFRIITGRVTIGQEAALKLPAGSTLMFANGGGLWAQGSLVAEGSADQPIRLTSWRDVEAGSQESGAQPGDWFGVWLEGATAAQSLRFVEIRFAGVAGQGVSCLMLNGAAPILADVTVRECGYYPVGSDLASDPTVERLTLAGNHPSDDWALRESKLARGTQRTLAAIPRLVTGWLSVEAGARLGLAPGLTLKFARGAGLWVGGGLDAAGTADQPIVLTSWRDPEVSREGGVQAGDWVGLAIENADGAVDVQHVEVRYAGGERNPRGGISVTGASPHLSDVRIRDSAWYPLSLDVKAEPRLDRLALSDNAPANAVEVRGSALDGAGERIWKPWTDANDAPLLRVVTGPLIIGEQAALRLEGVVVKFDTHGGLEVTGRLQTASATLTSLHDDEHGGDTDGRVEGERVWRGITLRGRALSQLQSSSVRYAETGLWLENATPRLQDTAIEFSRTAALSGDVRSTPDITNLTLADNAVNGLVIRDEALPEGETRWGALGAASDQLVRVIAKPFRIGARSQLKIEPGVVVKFGPQSGLVVEGGLQVGERGNTSTVTFTALADNTVGGDTQPTAPALNRGAWLGIVVNPNNTTASLALFGVNISYAQVGLFLTNLSQWEFESLTISNSQLFGVSCDALSAIPSDPQFKLTLVDNGGDTLTCPTPGR